VFFVRIGNKDVLYFFSQLLNFNVINASARTKKIENTKYLYGAGIPNSTLNMQCNLQQNKVEDSMQSKKCFEFFPHTFLRSDSKEDCHKIEWRCPCLVVDTGWENSHLIKLRNP